MRFRGFARALAASGAVAAFCIAGSVHAATFDVDSTVDAPDTAPGDGDCRAIVDFTDFMGTPMPIFGCTLRAAIMEANADPEEDTVELGTAVHELTLAGSDEDAAADGDLDIAEDLRVVGTSALGSQIDASAIAEAEAVFHVLAGASARFTGVLVTGGSEGVRNQGTTTLREVFVTENGGFAGAGVVNDGGSVTIVDSTVRQNGGAFGSGIVNRAGGLTLNRTAVHDNAGTFGGGISNDATADGDAALIAINSTISGNTAFGALDLVGAGGGINQSEMDTGTATTLLFNVTVADNEAESGGGISNSSGGVQLLNSVVAGNTSSGSAPDCGGEIVSDGFSWIGTTTGCSFSGGSSDTTDADAELGPLASNGGPSLSHLPVPGSGLVDGGNPAGCAGLSLGFGDPPLLGEDQRGQPRPFDGDGDGSAVCDIGAIEVQTVPNPSARALALTSLFVLGGLAWRRRQR